MFFSRLAAAGIVFAGPALLIYARSDLGPWSHASEKVFLSVPIGLFACAALGYAIVAGLIGDDLKPRQITVAALGSLVIPYLTLVAAVPILFGLGEACVPKAAAVVLLLLAIPTAVFQAAVLPRPSLRLFVIVAALFVSGGQPLVHSFYFTEGNCGVPLAYPTRIFGDAHELLWVIPYAALAFFIAKPVPPIRFSLALVCVLTPVYLFKASAELAHGDFLRAVIWPVRVSTDFVSWPERMEKRKENAARITAGQPVQIGEHWYRFNSVSSPNLSLDRSRDPDRIQFLQIGVPPRELDLDRTISPGRNTVLSIGVARRSTEQVEQSPGYVAARHADLSVHTGFHRGENFDHVDVRSKLQRFMEKSQIAPPLN